MTQEAVLLTELQPPISMVCADGTGIAKGAILTLTSPMTAALCAADEADVAGIAAAEKIADDGNVSIPVYRRGIFKVMASGSVTAGDTVATHANGDSNDVAVATATAVGGETLGIALESASDNETFRMELNPGCNNQAYS